MATRTEPYLTAAEYLAFERESEERHESFDGEVFAMSGARRRHNLIATNQVRALSQFLIEVLSTSTEGYDRGEKLGKRLSLREYVLVSQDAMPAERFVRQDAGRWECTEATGPHATLPTDALGAALELAEVYDKVSLDTADA